jgi:hypothetical protein
MNFNSLQTRLVETLREMVQSGQATERGLAKKTGISQPHIHNVLKGLRYFSMEVSDQILSRLQISVEDLAPAGLETCPKQLQLIPMLYPELGPNCTHFPDVSATWFRVPYSVVTSTDQKYAARLGPDPGMPDSFRRGDVVVLDRDRAACACPRHGESYVVETGKSILVRAISIDPDNQMIHCSRENADSMPFQIGKLGDARIPEVLRARVLWLGRTLETALSPEPFTADWGDGVPPGSGAVQPS